MGQTPVRASYWTILMVTLMTLSAMETAAEAEEVAEGTSLTSLFHLPTVLYIFFFTQTI